MGRTSKLHQELKKELTKIQALLETQFSGSRIKFVMSDSRANTLVRNDTGSGQYDGIYDHMILTKVSRLHNSIYRCGKSLVLRVSYQDLLAEFSFDVT